MLSLEKTLTNIVLSAVVTVSVIGTTSFVIDGFTRNEREPSSYFKPADTILPVSFDTPVSNYAVPISAAAGVAVGLGYSLLRNEQTPNNTSKFYS